MSVPQPVQDLRAAALLFDEVAKNVREDQLDRPTPCSEWSVRELIDHVGTGAAAFARTLGEEPRDPGYEAGREAQARAIERPVDLDQPVQMPFGTVPVAVALALRSTDCLVHAWDLADAIGQEISADDGLVQRCTEFSERTLAQLPPDQRVFGPATTPPQGATSLQRLVALLGREVR